MKRMIKKILEFKLKIIAQLILFKYKPDVVAITGSVGKTSTAQALYLVLSAAFNTRKNLKNYNNEIGIPLSIIGVESGGKSILGWLRVFFKATRLILFKDKNYPRVLVLEMGADHPGDISYLTSFVPIKVAVVTSVTAVHLEFFGRLEEVKAEKSVLVQVLSEDGFAVLNADDKDVLEMDTKTKAHVITFGLLSEAHVRGSDIELISNAEIEKYGTHFNLSYQGKSLPVTLPNIIAEHLVYSVLAAVAVGLIYEIDLNAIVETLKDFVPPNGRMRLLDGIKNTLIIDDTYNSSPLAARKAIYQLSKMPIKKGAKRYAVLGDMLELGSYASRGHREVGQAVAQYKIDYLITVGEMSRDTVRGAVAVNLAQDKCFNFKDAQEAGRFLQDRIKEEDIILVKGSQGMRMEKIVKEIMAEPDRAGELLVRQDKFWQ